MMHFYVFYWDYLPIYNKICFDTSSLKKIKGNIYYKLQADDYLFKVKKRRGIESVKLKFQSMYCTIFQSHLILIRYRSVWLSPFDVARWCLKFLKGFNIGCTSFINSKRQKNFDIPRILSIRKYNSPYWSLVQNSLRFTNK